MPESNGTGKRKTTDSAYLAEYVKLHDMFNKAQEQGNTEEMQGISYIAAWVDACYLKGDFSEVKKALLDELRRREQTRELAAKGGLGEIKDPVQQEKLRSEQEKFENDLAELKRLLKARLSFRPVVKEA